MRGLGKGKAIAWACCLLMMVLLNLVSCGDIKNDDCIKSGINDSSISADKTDETEESRPVNSEDVSWLACHISYTDVLDPGAIWPYGNIIRSKSELNSLISEIIDHNLYDLEKQIDGHMSFITACSKYDEEFFDSRALLVLAVQGYAENPPAIHKIYIENDRIHVEINCFDGNVGQAFHVIVEITNDYISSGTDLSVLEWVSPE